MIFNERLIGGSILTNARKNITSFLAYWFVLSLSSTASAGNLVLQESFSDKEREGTVVLSSLNENGTFIFNQNRSLELFAPASTFKILNTLIALEEGIIDSEGTEFIWDGTIYENRNWNRNHTLRSAFQVSCVWCFQVIASNIGENVYREYLQKLDYGKFGKNFDLINFWLNGDLKISAQNQIQVLERIVKQDQVFSESVYEKFKGVMRTKFTPEYEMYSKTGWDGKVSWFVGFVISEKDIWLFAANIDAQDIGEVMKDEDVTLMQHVIENVLLERGII